MNSSDILWYLLIGGLFLMMVRRGGCCGGHHQRDKDKRDAILKNASHLPLESLPGNGDLTNKTNKRSRT